MFVKVCGLRNKTDIEMAAKYGYDAIGVVLAKKSSRYITSDKAKELANYCRQNFPDLKTVAVGICLADVLEVKDFFDFVQLYENADIDNLIYSSSKFPKKIKSEYFIYDSSMGSGEFKGIPAWLNNIKAKIIIAGGLNQNNVAEIIEQTKKYCYGIDVSSGVETNGFKDSKKMKKFIKEVKNGKQV